MKETKIIRIGTENDRDDTTYLDSLLNKGWEIVNFTTGMYDSSYPRHYVLLIRTKK